MTSTLAAPTTPIEWENYVRGFDTPEMFHAALKDGSFTANLNAYKGAENKTMANLKAEMVEQVQASVVEMFKRNGVDDQTEVTNRLDLVTRARSQASASSVLNNPKAIGAGLNGMFNDIAEFLKVAVAGPGNDAEMGRKLGELRNYSEKIPSEGGLLVPEEFRSDIMSRSLEKSIVRPRAMVVPMATGKLRFPATDMTTEVGEVYGGIQMFWVDGGQEIPESSASFATVSLDANKLAGLAVVPNELVRDWAGFTAWIRKNLPDAITHFEDVALIKGDGVGKPLGALHSSNPAMIVVDDEGAAQTSGISWINVVTMYSRLLPESIDTAVWVVTPEAFIELATMALPVGTGGAAVWMPDAHGRPQLTLLGLPVISSRKAPATLNIQGDISLVDFSQYAIGDTQTMTLESSEHAKFTSDRTTFRIIERLDGQPTILSPLTPENGGPTLSAYVQLASR
jgi:HK97 family phage major capsid protein